MNTWMKLYILHVVFLIWYLINFFEKTPYELWRKRELNLKYLKVWGCLAKVNIPINKKRKIGPKTVDSVFVGYSLHSTTYRFLVVNSEVSEISNGTIMESRDATFFENVVL